MLKHSALAIALLVVACSDGDDGGANTGAKGGTNAGGKGGASGGSGGSGGTTGGSGGTGTTGGSGGATGGAGGATAGSGGSAGTGATGGAGGATGGAGGATAGAAGSKGGSGGASGSAGGGGSGAKDAGGAGAGGSISDGGAVDGSGGSGPMDVNTDSPPDTCPVGNFPAVTDFGKVGPFTVAAAEMAGPGCTIIRPATLGENGVKHPVIAWGNGTGGFVGVYNWILSHWASHGFIIAAANTGSAGTGNEMVACLDWVEQQNGVAGVYQGKVAVGRAGASGHSQGGAGALMTGRDGRILATAPVMPYILNGFGNFDQAAIKQQKGGMLLLSALGDTIAVPATNQGPIFMDTNVPVFWGTLASGNHVTFSLGGNPGYLAPTTAWFRLHLMCDASARPMFYGPSCTVCNDTANWTVDRRGL
jgi:hypothetical protein